MYSKVVLVALIVVIRWRCSAWSLKRHIRSVVTGGDPYTERVMFPYIAYVHCHSESMKNEEECKVADLCIHDKVPMCAIDSCGEMRTFLDMCDMHEMNCDSKKDFKQRPIHECWVTCKRGRSFKKPEFRADCNINTNKGNRI